MQEATMRPFSSTVQAPQTPTLHASLVPVRARSYRSRSTRVRRAGTSTS